MMMRRPSRVEKRFRSLTRLLAEELKTAIITGKLAPGERLSEEKLASSLKVGRVPLREALRRLEAEGYFTILSNNEVAVSKPTMEELQDYATIARVLEGLASRLAQEWAQPEKMPRLRVLHQLLREAFKDRHVTRL